MISTDILVKTAIEAGINDLRKNQWILPDILSWLAEDKMTAAEYGWKEIKAFTEFFNTNKLPVYLDFRTDSPELPCITVATIPRTELLNRTTLGDEGMLEDIEEPKQGVKRPVYVYPPFTLKAYDRSEGIVTMPDNLDTRFIVAGQFLVSARSGKAYQITECIDGARFRIASGISDDLTNAYIVPQVSAWNLQKELTFISEQVVIGVHAQGNPVHNQWMHDLTWYILLRCKEVYLENRGFELSTISSEPVYLNPNFKETDKVFSRNVTLSGQLEVSFIKYQAPKLQDVRGRILIIDGPKTPAAYQEQVDKQAWAMEHDKKPGEG